MSVKMLLEDNLSGEGETWQKQPNVIAKLMGLDTSADQPLGTFPDKTVPGSESSMQKICAACGTIQDQHKKWEKYKEGPPTYFQLGNHIDAPEKYKYVPETCLPCKTAFIGNKPLVNEICNDKSYRARMEFVRKNSLEGKCLVSNQKLLQTKDLQDAVEILGCNKDLFPICFEEPHSLLPNYLQKMQRSPLLTRGKNITLLKPSREMDGRVEKKKNNRFLAEYDKHCSGVEASCTSNLFDHKPESLSQATRIVVLRTRNPAQIKDLVTSTRPIGTKELMGSVHEPKEAALHRQGCQTQRRGGTFQSPTSSNGYAADEGSVYLSADDCTDDEFVNSNEVEIATPKSPHFLDCSNNLDKPRPLSSTKASYSLESPVIKEAKRRLSQRLVMVTSGKRSHELEHAQGNTNTLQEVLSLRDIRKTDTSRCTVTSGSLTNPFSGESQLTASSFRSFMDWRSNDDCANDVNLRRSKSVPSSLLINEHKQLKLEDSTSYAQSSTSSKGKSKNDRFSFKGKVSNFFLLFGKNTGHEKSSRSSSVVANERIQFGSIVSCGESNSAQSCDFGTSKELGSHYLVDDGRKLQCTSAKASVLSQKANIADSIIESLQPSSVLTLDMAVEDETMQYASKSYGISRCPPIGTLARSLSVESSHSSGARSNPSKHLRDLLMSDVEEHERIKFVQSLLASVGMDSGAPGSGVQRWHSLESPLDPMLLKNIIENKVEDARSAEKRSNKRLIFDCVNAALSETARLPTANSVMEEAIRRLQDWFSSHDKSSLGFMETSCQVVDRIVRKELSEKGWTELARSETTDLGREIEGQVLCQLLGEALDDVISSFL